MKYTSPNNLILHPDYHPKSEQILYYQDVIKENKRLPIKERIAIDESAVTASEDDQAKLIACNRQNLERVPFEIIEQQSVSKYRNQDNLNVITLDYAFEFPKISLDNVMPDDYF